ncbi:MAG: hypothetical protein IJ679_09675, partial [Lachnospiraceae bacterium]|nr:hypothetical protein [Lachnospiraceae bacterium]
RQGMFSHGYYTEVGMPGLKAFAKEKYREEVPEITEARMPFPKELLEINTTLSKTMEMWEEMPSKEGYLKESLQNEIRLVKKLEEMTSDKELIYRLVTLPFSERDRDLERFWESLAESEILNLPHQIHIPDDPGRISSPGGLAEAEKICSYLDLASQFCRVFGYEEDGAAVAKAKEDYSKRVIDYLNGGEYGEKRCLRCGRRMKWNARGGLCADCTERSRTQNWRRKRYKRL